MSTVPGNPYAKTADTSFASIESQATLAVAHELRTAALIAYAQVADDETADRLWVDHITPRLGLDEEA